MPVSHPRSPVHVVYGGANLFKADTPQKLGKIALGSLKTYASDVGEFAAAMGLEQMTKRVRIKCGRCRTVNVAVFDAKGET